MNHKYLLNMHAFKLAVPTVQRVILKLSIFSEFLMIKKNIICQEPEIELYVMFYFALQSATMQKSDSSYGISSCVRQNMKFH